MNTVACALAVHLLYLWQCASVSGCPFTITPPPLHLFPSPFLSHGHLFSISTILWFKEWLINRITEYRIFKDWLVTLSVYLWRFFQVAMCINSSFFYCWVVLYSTNIPLFVEPFTHRRTSKLFLAFGYYE